jgi:alpha-L-rhamnosidase
MTPKLLRLMLLLKIVTFQMFLLLSISGSLIAGKRQPNAGPRPVSLRTEYKQGPLGIDVRKPRLSWQIAASGRGVTQSAYQIRVVTIGGGPKPATETVWDSGKVASDESIQRPYEGPPLKSGQRYSWQVKIWDGSGAASDWSDPAYWEMGLLEPSDWQAKWIEPAILANVPKPLPVPMLRREFSLNGAIQSARAYVTCHGLYEMQLNGQRVGDYLFTPGWTSYNKRLQYETYDVTNQLRSGSNAVGVMLGDGWYRGDLTWDMRRDFYGTRVGLLMQIKVAYKDGREEIIGTDENWKASFGGPILMSEIYDGETYDARREKPGWSMPGFADSNWSSVPVAAYPNENLIAQAGPPVRRIQELKPVKIFKTPAGDLVADMGQNMVGWVKLKVEGPAGTTVTLRHAEVLDKQGNFYTENLRGAAETVRYTLKGGGPEVFEPRFTFQGFRYVAVNGYPGELTADCLTGEVIHSDMEPASEFETSKPLVNQLQHNIIWGQKGNFVDVPTDCPQRDERLGWTGDAQVFSSTAAFNMDVAGFFTKWLKDLAADQYPSGSVPYVIPDVLSSQSARAGGSAAWADSAVIIPWNVYRAYGDKRILEDQYPSMAAWVEYERKHAGDGYVWKTDFHFGDWLAFSSTSADYPGATTGKDLVATAFFAHSTDLLQRIAVILGRQEDAAKYAELLGKIKAAFCREFVTETGRVGENTQTAYVLALDFDLLPEKIRPTAAQRLADDVRARGHLTTGFVGTPYLCYVLSRWGHLDTAYFLLNHDQYPSWLYEVKQGATTIWERWDGEKPDGSFQDKSMNSFNHYAYGAVGDWMYRVMAGIDIDDAEPGYKHILIQPQPGGEFTAVRSSHKSMYGEVGSAWNLKGGQFELTIDIPANTHATVRLPKAQLGGVTESGRPVANGNGITGERQEGDSAVVEVGSGQYRFAYPIGN